MPGAVMARQRHGAGDSSRLVRTVAQSSQASVWTFLAGSVASRGRRSTARTARARPKARGPKRPTDAESRTLRPLTPNSGPNFWDWRYLGAVVEDGLLASFRQGGTCVYFSCSTRTRADCSVGQIVRYCGLPPATVAARHWSRLGSDHERCSVVT
jgi:hypothetical protein